MPNTAMGPMQIQLLEFLQSYTTPRDHGSMVYQLAMPAMTNMTYRQVESALARLKRRGLVEEVGTHRTRKIWRLTKAGRKYQP